MLKSSHITFNTNYTFTNSLSNANSSNRTYDLQSITLHELGHSMGLNHIQDNNTVMRPTAHGFGKRNLDVYDEYYFYQIYKNQAAGGTRSLILDELDDEYWTSRGLVFEPVDNYLSLRQLPMKIQSDKVYDIELGMDIFYLPLDDEQMIDFSDLVIRGHVKEITTPWWNTTDGKMPSEESILEYSLFHDVIIEVEEVYKGELTGNVKEIRVRQVGGSLDNVRQTTSIPEYYMGEEVILYLVKEDMKDDDVIFYTQINEKGQLFIVGDNVAVNGIGQKVNIETDIVSSIEKRV